MEVNHDAIKTNKSFIQQNLRKWQTKVTNGDIECWSTSISSVCVIFLNFLPYVTRTPKEPEKSKALWKRICSNQESISNPFRHKQFLRPIIMIRYVINNACSWSLNSIIRFLQNYLNHFSTGHSQFQKFIPFFFKFQKICLNIRFWWCCNGQLLLQLKNFGCYKILSFFFLNNISG